MPLSEPTHTLFQPHPSRPSHALYPAYLPPRGPEEAYPRPIITDDDLPALAVHGEAQVDAGVALDSISSSGCLSLSASPLLVVLPFRYFARYMTSRNFHIQPSSFFIFPISGLIIPLEHA